MRLNVRAKVLLAVSISLILIFALIIYILVEQNTSRLRSSLNEQTKSFAALATDPIGDTFSLHKDSGRLRITQEVNKFLELDPDVTSIQVVGVDGNPLFSSQEEEPGAPIDAALAASFEPEYITNDKGYIEKVVQPFFEDSGAHRYSVVYTVSTKRVERNVTEVVSLIFYTGIGILAISIAATGFMLSAFFINPLRQVSKSANIISSGDYDHKIEIKNRDEIGDLAHSVQKMADFLKADIAKLRELDKLKTEFMMIASHNLRTPLTIIEGYVDMAESANSTKELKSIIKTIQDSVVRLHLLAENVLTISTLEANKTLRKSPAEISGFIDNIGNEFSPLADKKGLKWNFENKVPKETKADINSTNLHSALGNLIDNAIKFTKAGGAVTVEASIESGDLVFKVEDDGIGIDQEEMPKLFSKFHRGTSTLSYDYEGVGIGLYLAKLILEQHGGSVEARSELSKGSTFTARFPLTSNQAGSGSIS